MHAASHEKNGFHPTPNYFQLLMWLLLTNKH